MLGRKAPAGAKAKILADEGYTCGVESPTDELEYEKWIVEVHPDDEPAFRTEVVPLVSWPIRPQVGDIVQVE